MNNINTAYRKARKNHICDFCGSNIFKGEMYEHQKNVNDGQIYEWKSCQYCESIVSKMFEELVDDGDGLNDQHFNDFISENDIDFKKR